ncbi:MAG: SusD/RagB family nutrient-binding outer membrane lipoprotein, partial [Bacteroidetes bacterium]|nr:SusD/RagB family nutrient-binding outer membrane lipoprotein [Bacteroidota bacterium]
MQRLIPVLLAVLSLSACTKDFRDINNDPNRPKAVTPGVMLGQLQYKMINSSIGTARNFTHELMQVTAPRISADGNGVHRYVITAGAASGFWNSMYSYMTDVNDIYHIADSLKENNYKAIALIYKCWAYSMLTDVFGDVPYSQATLATAGNVKPAFDGQKSIYIQLLKDLETANGLFDDSKLLTYGGDQIYAVTTLTNGKNTGIQKWKKLCNSLRLRLLLRISKRDGEIDVQGPIRAILADPVKYPVFTANADEAIFRYPGTYPYYNPYYNARTLDWRQGDYYTSFFIDKMNADNDPRRSVWATQVKVNNVNVYQGIGSGYPTTTSYVVDANSSYSDGLKTLPQLGVMMSWAEVEFIKA